MDAFTWRDGERLIRFGSGVLADAPRLVAEGGFDGYALLTTERARGVAPDLEAGAAAVLRVRPGRVDEIAAELLEHAGERPLVALGGGRVIDTAKAIASVGGGRCAALPTTLSGAEMTPFHRFPAGSDAPSFVRPALVVADPELMATQGAPQLAASAMNALAHAMEALYTPLANPLAELAALRATELIARALPETRPDREALALGAVLAGYASGSAGLALHHATCQTIVRLCATPHAETNAVMLPYFARLMAARAPAELGAFAAALGDPEGDPEAAAGRAAKLAARSGHIRLSTLGASAERLPHVADTALQHRAIGLTPDPPDRDELLALLEEAL